AAGLHGHLIQPCRAGWGKRERVFAARERAQVLGRRVTQLRDRVLGRHAWVVCRELLADDEDAAVAERDLFAVERPSVVVPVDRFGLREAEAELDGHGSESTARQGRDRAWSPPSSAQWGLSKSSLSSSRPRSCGRRSSWWLRNRRRSKHCSWPAER